MPLICPKKVGRQDFRWPPKTGEVSPAVGRDIQTVHLSTDYYFIFQKYSFDS